MAELAEVVNVALLEGAEQELLGRGVVAAAKAVAQKVAKPPKLPKPPKAAPGEKKAKRVKIPKTIASYWRAKDKNPEYFVYTADGGLGTFLNAEEEGKLLDVPVKLFSLPTYAPISREALDGVWAKRQEEFTEIYKDIEVARDRLREAITAYQAGAGTTREVVIANQLVAEQEARLVSNRSAKRWIENIPNPATNHIDLSQKYETRTIGFDVYELKQVAIDPQKLLRELTPEEAANAREVKRGGGMISLGVVTDESPLGLHWPSDVRVGNTKYFTAFQALLGEAARRAGREDLFQSILGTRSSRTLRSLTKDFTSEMFPSDLLDTVIKAIAKDTPRFRELLLETGDDRMIYANIMDPIFSNGLDANDPSIQNLQQGTGENLWGEALEHARTEFRQENVVNKKDEEGISEKDLVPVENEVISKEQQDSAKKAAIINAKRFHRNH